MCKLVRETFLLASVLVCACVCCFYVQVSSNLYLGGCHGIESPSVKEQTAFAARAAGARYERLFLCSYYMYNGAVTTCTMVQFLHVQ